MVMPHNTNVSGDSHRLTNPPCFPHKRFSKTSGSPFERKEYGLFAYSMYYPTKLTNKDITLNA